MTQEKDNSFVYIFLAFYIIIFILLLISIMIGNEVDSLW